MNSIYYDGIHYWIEKVSLTCKEYLVGRLREPYFYGNDGSIWVVLPDKSCRKDIRYT